MSILATGTNTYIETAYDNTIKEVYKGPVEVSSAEEMELLCSSSNAGVIYKYIGPTTDKYVTNEYYIVSEVS